MSETKPGMSSPALTEKDVKRIISHFVMECGVQIGGGDIVINRRAYTRWLARLHDTTTDQAGSDKHE